MSRDSIRSDLLVSYVFLTIIRDPSSRPANAPASDQQQLIIHRHRHIDYNLLVRLSYEVQWELYCVCSGGTSTRRGVTEVPRTPDHRILLCCGGSQMKGYGCVSPLVPAANSPSLILPADYRRCTRSRFERAHAAEAPPHSVSAHHRRWTDAHLEIAAHFQSLRLDRCKQITDAGIAVLSKMKMLQSVGVHGCARVTIAGEMLLLRDMECNATT